MEKDFKKQTKTTEDQWKKQVDALSTFKPIKDKKSDDNEKAFKMQRSVWGAF